jgi:putative lipoprotein
MAKPWAIAVAALTLLSSAPARAADPDPWFGRDKALHFGASVVIAAGGYGAGAIAFDARSHALLLGGGLALVAGIGKETLDLAGFGDPSWRDLTWDVIGTVAGLAVAWSVDLVVRGASDRHPLLGPPHVSGPGVSAPSMFVVAF